jgi:hypothetical protein
MKPIIKYTLIGLLIIVAAGITVAGVAYAQGDDPDFRGGLAELLGLSREELREQIQSGKTIEELAEEAGVDLEAYREEMQLNREENLRNRIEEALADGTITQEQADWLLEGLEKGFLNGPFFGRGGRGMGEPGGEFPPDGERMPGMRRNKSETE